MTDEEAAALIAKTRTATIDDCQRWLRQSAATLERAGMYWPVRRVMLAAANNYRSAANVLEALKPEWLGKMERAS